MKRNKNLFAYLLILLMGNSIWSCTTDFEDINTNPNAPSILTDASPLIVHTLRFSFTESRYVTWRGNLIYGLRFAEQCSFSFEGTWFGNGQGFSLNQGWNDALWDDMYADRQVAGTIEDILKITAPGAIAENAGQQAMTEIIRVCFYHRLTDYYGHIPYFDAGKGVIPKFDTQKEIYNDMMKKLGEAITALEALPGNINCKADYIFNGDKEKWIKFANTYRLRLAMRARNGEGSNSSQVITECLKKPLMTGPEDSFVAPRDPKVADFVEGGFYAIWHGFDPHSSQWKVSELMINTLKQSSDPRLYKYALPNKDGKYIGLKVALNNTEIAKNSFDDFSSPAEVIHQNHPRFPAYVLTYAECEFLKAEAAAFKLGGSDANTHYRNGIKASMEQWGVSSEDIQSYLTTEKEANLYGDSENQLRQIATQRWIHAYHNGYEAWSIIRRTGYPHVAPKDNLTIYANTQGGANNKYPQRLIYPVSTVSLNETNVKEAIEDMGPDLMTTKLWWAK